MLNQTNEHITKGEKVVFDCDTIATLTHMSPDSFLGDKYYMAGITLNFSEYGVRTNIGRAEEIELLLYIRNIPSIIHMLQRIYKTGMGTH